MAIDLGIRTDRHAAGDGVGRAEPGLHSRDDRVLGPVDPHVEEADGRGRAFSGEGGPECRGGGDAQGAAGDHQALARSDEAGDRLLGLAVGGEAGAVVHQEVEALQGQGGQPGGGLADADVETPRAGEDPPQGRGGRAAIRDRLRRRGSRPARGRPPTPGRAGSPRGGRRRSRGPSPRDRSVRTWNTSPWAESPIVLGRDPLRPSDGWTIA